MFWDSKFWTLQMDSFTTNNGNDFFHFSFAPGLILYARNRMGTIFGASPYNYEGVSKSFRTGHLERELQMVQHSATRYICIAIL